MDSFLNRLASRALGLAPVAEPIIPARFTPHAGEVSPLRSETSDRTGLDRREDATVRFAVGSEEARRSAAPVRPHRDAETDAVGPVHRRVRSVGDRDEANAAAYRKPYRPALATPQISGDVAGDRISLPADHGVPQRQDGMQPVMMIPQPPVNTVEAHQLVPTRSQKNLATARTARENIAETAADGATVHVSIGRIEVRAEIARTEPAAPRRSRPATLSLSDYLRQQGETRR